MRHRSLSSSRAVSRRRSRSLRGLACRKGCLAAGFPVAQSRLELPQPVQERRNQMTNGPSLSLAELEQRIAIARDNIRQLIEQAAALSGAEDEDRNADRIAQQQEELDRLVKQRDQLLKK
jgi:uncharacterized small protein (DUF1192 family)